MIYNLEKKSKTKLNLSSIKNILTIRYDITKNPTKKLAVVKDFEKSLIDQGSHMSEKLLTNSFKKMKLCNFNHQIDLKTGLREMVGESIADR